MPTSNNDTRTPKTPRKIAATPAVADGTATRKRATKKAVGAEPGPAPKATSTASIASGSAPPTPSSPVHAAARPVSVTAGARPATAIATVVDAEERCRMIAEAAYHKFLQRGPGNGTPGQDWIEAEAEIDALLAEQHIARTQ